MESNIQTEKQKKDEVQIKDIYKDEYWAKKYDVSTDQLEKTGKIGIFEKIVEASIRNKSFSV
jgi:hypothetical protein